MKASSALLCLSAAQLRVAARLRLRRLRRARCLAIAENRAKVLELLNGDPEFIKGCSTGWEALDEYYNVVPGELTIVTGTPGSGKSEWLLSMCMNLAEQKDWRIGLISFEHKPQDIAVSLLEKRRGHLAAHMEIAGSFQQFLQEPDTQFLKDHFSFIGGSFEELPRKNMMKSAQWLAEKCREEQKPLKGLVIDPYNYVERDGHRGTETEFASDFLSELRRFAKQNKVHIWLVVHPLKRSGWADAAKPSLYDCMGSAHFYNKCDMGLVLVRSKGTHRLNIHVEKVRNGEAGQRGQVKLCFNESTKGYECL